MSRPSDAVPTSKISRWLPALAVHRPVTTAMVFLALCVLGGIAWSRIPLEMMPGRFQLSKLWVWVPYPRATPKETLNQVLRPIEEHVATAPGISEIDGRASADSARLRLSFHRSISMDAAYDAVVDRMERALPELPDGVDDYYVYRWDPSDEPVMWVGLSLPEEVEDGEALLHDLVAKRLVRVPGVGKVDTWGTDPYRVFIDFNLDALISHGVEFGELLRRLGQDGFQLASGRIRDRGQVHYVRSLARWQSVEQLRTYPLGQGLVLSDLADVELRPDPSPDIGRIDGTEGVGIAVYKESSANTVDVTHRVAAAMARLEKDSRLSGATFHTFFDQGKLIEESLDNLLKTAFYGGLFAVAVLFVLLRQWRLTLLIAACIPVTLLLTVTLMDFTGRTLNLLSLLGLMLAVGMVVDNAIVVVEAIHARRSAGEEPNDAAISGTAEVGLAITLSTLTTMVVFLPVILMSEDANFSFFMGEMGFPVVWALGASLLVALVFVPLATTFIRGRGSGSTSSARRDPSDRPEPRLLDEPRWSRWMTERYRRALCWTLAHRTDALAGLVALGSLTVGVPAKAVGCRHDTRANLSSFVIRYEVQPDFTEAERLQTVETVEELVEAHEDEWGVRAYRSWFSGASNHGYTWVYLYDDPPEGALSREEVIEAAKKDLPSLPGVELGVGWGHSEGSEPNQLDVTLRGDDTETLESLGREAERRLEAIPGVIGVTSEVEGLGGREVRLYVDRAAAGRFGVSPSQIGRLVSFALRGTQLADFLPATGSSAGGGGPDVEHPTDMRFDVVARFRLEDRQDLAHLLEFPVGVKVASPPPAQSEGARGSRPPAARPEGGRGAGRSVPLRSLVDIEFGPAAGPIYRKNRRTAWPLTIELAPEVDPDSVRGAVAAAMDALRFPRGYGWEPGSQDSMEARNDQARSLALLLSITFVFLLMGVLFESFILPLSVIATIPMALLGVYWTLFASGTPLDLMGGVGLVILVGVVVNNGIVLVDLVTRLRQEGLSRTEALVQAGTRRLRPILMTALTTIFGMLPMAVGNSTFVGIPYAPLGRVVAGGLVASTGLTLFFVPFLYSVLDDMRGAAGRWAAWISGRPASAPTDAVAPTGSSK